MSRLQDSFHYLPLVIAILINTLVYCEENNLEKLKMDFCSKALGLEVSAAVNVPEKIRKKFPGLPVTVLNNLWKQRSSCP